MEGAIVDFDDGYYFCVDDEDGVALAVRWNEDARRSRGKMGEVTAESRALPYMRGHVRMRKNTRKHSRRHQHVDPKHRSLPPHKPDRDRKLAQVQNTMQAHGTKDCLVESSLLT